MSSDKLFFTLLLLSNEAKQREIKAKRALGRQLRIEFNDFSDEITDEYVETLVELDLTHDKEINEIQKKIKKMKSSWFKKADEKEIQILEKTIKQIEEDHDRKEREITPKRFQEYLDTLPEEEQKRRFSRAVEAVNIELK